MPPVRRIVLDVLKPYEPPIVEFTEQVADVRGVEAVTASLIELDQEVQNLKLTFEGSDVELAAIEETIDALGATVHSVDQVACGGFIVEDRRTPQDG